VAVPTKLFIILIMALQMSNEHMTMPVIKPIGLGDGQFSFAVYIANQPNLPEYQSLSRLTALTKGEIANIGQACGNGWRKVFNVYAKLLYALDKKYFSFSEQASTWQEYRDLYLLQQGSGTALIFNPPNVTLFSNNLDIRTLHIICGRTYAKQLISDGLDVQLIWLDDEFAVDVAHNVVVCPYFDYRQLSNHKIQRLSVMLSALLLGEIVDLN